MPRKKGMKLDQALKLYIALYCLCFGLTWLISVPMLNHVTPKSECLLFVSPTVEYGPSAACYFVGFTPIAIAVATLTLIVLHFLQLKSLKAFLKTGGRSADYNQRPPHIFWRLVVFHGLITFAVLGVAAIVTAGYATTCDNLHQEVWYKLRKRFQLPSYGGGQSRVENHDIFADDRSINRYTNDYRNPYGGSVTENSITCRSILTDPDIHLQLKQNHAEDPYFKAYFGIYQRDDIADVGDIRFLTYRDNTVLEMAMAGSWISFAIWLAVLILMLKERHHIKAHLTDESMWGSEFGGASRRSVGSRMSNQSFDKMSGRYSNQSGSRYSHSRSQRHEAPSLNGSYAIKQQQPRPIATSQPPINQNSFLNYFNPEPTQEEVIDVDEAINEGLDQVQMQDMSYLDGPEHDTSFEIPVNLDQTDGLDHDVLPMGDEVSMGVISRESGHFDTPQPPMPNPNRVTGRRGGGRSGGGGRTPVQQNGFPRPESQPRVVSSELPYQREQYEIRQQPPTQQIRQQQGRRSQPGYRTQLGNQSMI